MMNLKIVFLLLLISICPSVFAAPQESVVSDESLLMRVKLLITRGEGGQEEFDYIQSALDGIKAEELQHEVSFYRSLLLIKSGSSNSSEIVDLLKNASEGDHPLAIALLYKIYSEPFLYDEKCSKKAEKLKARYLELYSKNVISAGFDTALSAVNKMVL